MSEKIVQLNEEVIKGQIKELVLQVAEYSCVCGELFCFSAGIWYHGRHL